MLHSTLHKQKQYTQLV